MPIRLTDNTRAIKRSYIILFAAIAVAICTTGYGYFLDHKRITLEQEKRSISAIADLKAQQIRQWRQECLNDAESIAANAMLAQRLDSYLAGRAGSEVLSEFRSWMKHWHELAKYHSVKLYRTDGSLLVSNDPGTNVPDTPPPGVVTDTLKNPHVLLSDFHRDTPQGAIHLNLTIPIKIGEEKQSRTIAVLVLDIDPEIILYPLIRNFPTENATAETLLVERNGNQVLYLSNVRHLRNSALNRRESLADPALPTVLAALGNATVLEGKDYRGVDVLAATRTIPDSPWALVAKIDSDEIFGPVREKAWLVFFTVLLATAVAGMILYTAWRNRSSRFLKQEHEAEQRFNAEKASISESRRESEERLRTITSSVQDAIIMLDEEGNISFWNEAAEQIFGYTADAVLGRNLHEFLVPQRYHQDHRQAFEHFQRSGQGNAIGKITELSALHKDGHELPVELSLSAVQVRGVWQSIGVIRDISTRKLIEEKLLQKQQQLEDLNATLEAKVQERTTEILLEKENFKSILDSLQNGVYIVNRSYEIEYANPALIREFGPAEGEKCYRYLHGLSEPCPWCGNDEVYSGRTISREWASPASGKIFQVTNSLIRKADGTVSKLAVLQDITDRKQAEEAIRNHSIMLEKQVQERTRYLEITNRELEERRRETEELVEALQEHEAELINVSERLILATSSSNIGVWEIDLVTDRLNWDDMMFSLYGTEREQFQETLEEWKEFVHPDDVDRVLLEVQAAIGESREFNTHFRILWPDGSLHHLKSTAVIQRDSENKAIRMLGTNWDITDLKVYQESLLKLSRAVENSPATVVITDSNGRIEYVNPKFTQVTGYLPEEAIGSNPRILNAGVQPKYFFKNLWDTILSGEEWQGNICNRKKSGEMYWEQVSVSPIRDEQGTITHFVGVKYDITEQKRILEELDSSRQMLSDIIDFLPDATLVVDNEKRVIAWNKAIEAMSGISKEDILGKGNYASMSFYGEPQPFLLDLIDNADQGLESRYRNLVHDGKIIYAESYASALNNGTGAYLWIAAAPLYNQDNIRIGTIETIRDISSRRQIEMELSAAKEAAESANAMKSQFLANMSHEIRTPLNAIIGFSCMALKTDLTPRQKDYIEKISTAGDLLLSVINDILDHSKIEAGKLDIEEAPFRLDSVINNLTAVLKYRAVEKGLELLVQIDPQVPRYFIGDSHRLSQIITNLVGNAIKFTEKGSIVLSIKLKTRSTDGTMLLFSVHDTGIGISGKQLARLFQPFTQADGSITRKFGGTGLGLSISKKLVQMLGGEIWCDSLPGEGSTFSFTVRFKESDESAIAGEVLPVEKQPGFGNYSFAGSRILLVEDFEINRQLVIELLSETGIAIDVAANGKEALELLSSRDADYYDLVLMDIQMPVMGGYEATSCIRGDERLRQIPIVAMTAFAMMDDQARVMEAGMDACITKPFRLDELLKVVARYAKQSAMVPTEQLPLEEEMDASDIPAIPGIDCTAALERLDGDLKLYLWVLRTFLETESDAATIIAKAMDAGDMDFACRLAHTIKGTAGNMGADDLQQTARYLEHSISEKAPMAVQRTALADFTAEMTRVIDNLRRHLPQETAPSSTALAGIDIEVVAPILAKLMEYIKGRDGKAEYYLDNYRTELAALTSPDVEQLRKQLSCFDFDAAGRSLVEMAGKMGITLAHEREKEHLV